MEKRVVIRFFAPINQQTVSSMINVIENKLREGASHFKIVLSSLGGDVHSGISAYNYLKGISAKIETFNFGSVDSIAGVIYCAGEKRYTASSARFLIHGVRWNSNTPVSLELKNLKEITEGLKVDSHNIAKIISETLNKKQRLIENLMFDGKTYNASEATDFGLAHEVRESIIEEGDEVIGIG